MAADASTPPRRAGQDAAGSAEIRVGADDDPHLSDRRLRRGCVILGAAVVLLGAYPAQPDAASGGEGAAERQVPEPLSGPPRRGVPGNAGRRARRGAQHAAGLSGRSRRFRRVRRRARLAAGADAMRRCCRPTWRGCSAPDCRRARRRGGCRRCGSSTASCCARACATTTRPRCSTRRACRGRCRNT